MHRPKDANFAGGYLMQSIVVMPITYIFQLTRSTGIWGKELREKMNAYNHIAGINMHGGCLPNEDSFLELSDEPDQLGLPKPRIYFTAGENEKRMGKHGEKLMKQIWEAAGAKNIFIVQRNAHTIGNCRMGNEANTCVINAEGRSFDIPNLSICDNSVFPSALSVNPSLTIMAVALGIADLFLNKYLSAHKN